MDSKISRIENSGKKIAIVTGGSAGLGLAIARKFTQNNILTIIIGRNEEKLKKAIAQLGENCFYKKFDLCALSDIPALVENIIDNFGEIDILVNNAGINMKNDFTQVKDEDFQDVLTINLSAVFSLSREVVKHMLIRCSGSIINISSMAAQYGIPKVVAYSASKTTIEGMTRAMAVELSPNGIRVNAVAPGFIYSDMTSKALDSDPQRKAKVFGRTPMGHMGQPEDIAEAVYFLSGESAKYITGVVLPVDGGNSIGF
jgi:NAD(P)-dependent dehydrogenase (short-subunit alcohol dehydrogenase family)